MILALEIDHFPLELLHNGSPVIAFGLGTACLSKDIHLPHLGVRLWQGILLDVLVVWGVEGLVEFGRFGTEFEEQTLGVQRLDGLGKLIRHDLLLLQDRPLP